ncbi:Nudix family hydrolase [Pseudomaricurvus sp. HS19]|uniref:Nudix family hydrolase n=1 Tax=Pseudomaricurvus sp. HS19 TaxID=2692626 RepID=UPI00136D09D2|nr:Nudix family hydrolase [Pseudomaricurvus sp. HS19]MYM64698.1 Nudix family hydrolase [Pseudomaricurvus sp. HS19]
MSKVIHVAAGVIKDAAGQILIARRPDTAHQGGLWEFPGGKLEAGESAPQALARELHEELGIHVEHCEPLIQIRHDYPDKSVLLDVWTVDAFAGEPHGREGQPVRWVAASDLGNYDFPAANVPIVTAARLPKLLAISAPTEDQTSFCRNIHSAIDKGAALIQVRQPGWGVEQWLEGLEAAANICRQRQARLVLNSPPSVVLERCADVIAGIHLSAVHLQNDGKDWRKIQPGWLSYSCHNPEEIRQAEQLGADFITLSPVMPTSTHPQAEALGWDVFAQWVGSAKIPVYALGGMDPGALLSAINSGAQGVAGISLFAD